MSIPAIMLSVAPSNGKPQRIVESRAGEVVYRDSFDPNSAASRRRFIAALANKLAVDPAELGAVDGQIIAVADAADAALELALANEAAQSQTAPPTIATYPEVDPSRIVRPERFIAPLASGLSVPVRSEIDGHIVGRWLIYVRHADGRRECRTLTGSVELGAAGRLFVHPQPSQPSGNAVCGWSADARREWLRGSPVADPAEIFAQLCEQFALFVDLPPEQAAGITATLSLWAMLTYVYHAWPAVPYLFVGGPAGSGKSRVFEVLSRLTFRPLASSNLTAAALFRTMNDRGGTLLLDEAERLRQGSDPATADLLSMLLAGYKRGGRATRLEAVGDSFRTIEFDVFGPKALACIAGLPTALATRCIPVTMFRAPPGSEKPRRRIDGEPAAWQRLRDDLHSLALEHGATWLDLAERTDVCPSMSGRDYELWQPLLSLAAWIESHGAHGLRGLVEAHALSTIDLCRDDQTPDTDETLLRILTDALRNGERPTPGDILAKAKMAEPNMFDRWSAHGIGRLLKRYGIASHKYGGRRAYLPDALASLQSVQSNYGLGLGLEEAPQMTQMTHGERNAADNGLF
ncbi:MAG: hypothetical protein IT427_15470 [Pirellulales bacterium]|nr:hypothetical protein [Pirellulales bacterium]